jgi:transposase
VNAKEFRRASNGVPISVETVLAALERLEQRLARVEAENERLKERLKAYEPVAPPTEEVCNPTDYSLDSHEKQKKRKRKSASRRGRRKLEEKVDKAEKWEDVLPAGAAPEECVFARYRVAWRLIDGKAVLVCYRLHRRRGSSQTPQVPGLFKRCEYGVEFAVIVAFLTCTMRVSLDQACELLAFFCGLQVRKSQLEALLRQLARHWEPEYEALCDLIAMAAVVYMDETGWPIGKDNTSLWVFLSKLHSVFLFGCRKDADTLEEILPRDVFNGIGVSDDASVYSNRFTAGQKCMAHLLRKAIKLALVYPEKECYRRFLDDLCALYCRAKRIKEDARFSQEGRRRKVEELSAKLVEICEPHQAVWEGPQTPDEKDYSNLVYELLRLDCANELFTFVIEPEVDPTNNVSERALRGAAEDRKIGRTSKTAAGAARRSILCSVLASLKKNLERFTLAAAVAEVLRWSQVGVGLFREQLAEARARLCETPALATSNPRRRE